MEITATTLREQYERLSSERLVDMQSSGTLTAVAQSVVEEVLDERGVLYGDEPDVEELDSGSKETNDVKPTATKWEALGWTLIRWWGVVFRTLFIPLVGILGYFWFEPKSIGDVPFSQLTLNQVFESLFGSVFSIAIAGGSIWWFFSFPDQSKAKTSEENPYATWGLFGGLIVLMTAMAFFWLINRK